jgi:hypothetical protein
MNYTSVTNPIWADAEHSAINCIVDFTADGVGTVPFTANPLDTSNSSSKQIFDECVAGDYGTVAEYVPPAPYVPTADDNKATAVSLLQQTDWTTIGDVGNSAMSNPYLANQAEFIAWRSKVRAIAVTPVAGTLPVFGEMPQEVWQTV